MKQIKRTSLKFKEYAQNQGMLIPPTLDEMIDAQKVSDTINKINEVLKDKPVSKKVSQKLKYAKKIWSKNLDKYDQQEKMLNGPTVTPRRTRMRLSCE